MISAYKHRPLSISHAVLGFMDDVDTRLEEAERQFASEGPLHLVEESIDHLPMYIDLWDKPCGQAFKY